MMLQLKLEKLNPKFTLRGKIFKTADAILENEIYEV